ncbi:MAG: putative Ig domain-containing protein [Verrucomicrobiota bacterium]
MKTLFLSVVLTGLLFPVTHAQQALTIGPKHRYRFDNASGAMAAGTQITDSIGTSHGFIRGTGASANGAGLRLTGGSSASAPYVDLPNASVSGSAEIFPGLAEASYEVWVTVHSVQNWSRILDFGNNSIDEVTAPGGTFNGADYLIVSANIGTANNIRFERGGQFLTGGGQQDIAGATTIGTRMQLVATYDTASSAWKLHKNGVLIATVPTLLGPSTLDDLNVWLGRSNWAGDSNTDATYEEFRIYDYALTTQQILGNYQAGPDILTSENHAPVFASNPLGKPAATIGTAYSNSIAADASDIDPGDTRTFSKIAGPGWLAVASNGSLSGTPASGTAGVNAFTVRVADAGGLFSDATLNITVLNTLPGGWTAADIGSVGLAGSASQSSGVYTVRGSGADIGGTADGFQSVWQTLAGDGEIRARVTSQTNSDAWAKAGVMIRDGSGAGATNAFMAVTPANGFIFQARATASGNSNLTQGPAINPIPNNWVRLTRSGNLLSGYSSSDGVTWTARGSGLVSMTNSVSVGLAVTSRNNAVLSTATFDNVSVTPYLAPWLSADVGTTGLQGSAEYFGGAHTVKGAGSPGGTTDGFRYVYQTLSADGSIVARVSTLQNTGTSSRVGVMMRDTLASNSRMAALTVSGSGAWRWQRRTTTGGSVSTTNSSSGTAPNLWVRLSRSGNTVTAARSTNGTVWTTISSVTVTMATNYYVGLAVASGSTSTLNTSVMDNVTIGPAPAPLNLQQDLDGDGLADAWESIYYPPNQFGPESDPDGDGQSNRNEFAAGTSPTDSSDVTRLRIKSVSPALFEFEGRSDRSYTLERMIAPGYTQWEQVAAVPSVLADGTIELADPYPLQGGGIYRLGIRFPGIP